MRSVLFGLWGAALIMIWGGVTPLAAQDNQVFSRQVVLEQARSLAEKPFSPPQKTPERLSRLDYSTYSKIRYRKDEAIWGRAQTAFSAELFPAGYLYDSGVDIFVVESGKARQIQYDPNQFEAPNPEVAELLKLITQFAGFRLHYPLNRDTYRDEFIVFQGASYFRAVSKNQVYGLSARGLALDVAEPTGEEFPIFRRFWIERPAADARSIVVHALLDSRRVTGAYRFGIYPRSTTVLAVDMTLFVREPINHVGIGALTSMYAHGAIDGPDRADYRPNVHDSQGLEMLSGGGEWIWRPLSNPATLQISAFRDRNPKGFGLIQRTRRFDDYQDIGASYEKRPSAWVEPEGDWGEGHVILVEIPSNSEFNDNIVAYWRPDAVLEPGKAHKYAYRLTWPNSAPVPREMSRVARSAYGRAVNSGQREFVVDYGRTPLWGPGAELPEIDLHMSSGQLTNLVTMNHPGAGGFRVFATFEPGNEQLIEFRIQPRHEGRVIGETWLYRWIAR